MLVHCTFGGLLPPDGILPAAKFTLRPSLAFSYCQRYCTTLEQRPSAKLWQGTRNGITELSQKAPRIFGWRPSRWASAHILVPNRALLYSVQLCCKDAERWLVSSCRCLSSGATFMRFVAVCNMRSCTLQPCRAIKLHDKIAGVTSVLYASSGYWGVITWCVVQIWKTSDVQ